MVQAAEALHNRDDAWKEIVKAVLEDEFPQDQEMKKFAEDKFSDIVRFLMDDQKIICIRRSLSHGLEMFVDD